MSHSRSTVAGCLAIIALPPEERVSVVAEMNRMEEASRAETYTYNGCATPKCKGKVQVVRATDNPNLCATCYLARKK